MPKMNSEGNRGSRVSGCCGGAGAFVQCYSAALAKRCGYAEGDVCRYGHDVCRLLGPCGKGRAVGGGGVGGLRQPVEKQHEGGL